MSLITRSEYELKYKYVMSNLIAKYSVKPIKKKGRVGYYDLAQLNDIRTRHIESYLAVLKEKGFVGEAFACTEIELVTKRSDLNYKLAFVREKAARTGTLEVTVQFRLNKGLKELNVSPLGHTYNSKLIYAQSDLDKAYNYALRLIALNKKKPRKK